MSKNLWWSAFGSFHPWKRCPTRTYSLFLSSLFSGLLPLLYAIFPIPSLSVFVRHNVLSLLSILLSRERVLSLAVSPC